MCVSAWIRHSFFSVALRSLHARNEKSHFISISLITITTRQWNYISKKMSVRQSVCEFGADKPFDNLFIFKLICGRLRVKTWFQIMSRRLISPNSWCQEECNSEFLLWLNFIGLLPRFLSGRWAWLGRRYRSVCGGCFTERNGELAQFACQFVSIAGLA